MTTDELICVLRAITFTNWRPSDEMAANIPLRVRDAADRLEQLQQRVEKLEKENTELTAMGIRHGCLVEAAKE